MKSMQRTVAGLTMAVAALIVAGCQRPEPEAVAPPAPAPTAALTPEQELERYCRVCTVDKGVKHEEYLPDRLNVVRAGKTYRFCNDDCRKTFNASPGKYELKG